MLTNFPEEKEKATLQKKILLLDFDNTLIIQNREGQDILNPTVIKLLSSQNFDEIFIFTNRRISSTLLNGLACVSQNRSVNLATITCAIELLKRKVKLSSVQISSVMDLSFKEEKDKKSQVGRYYKESLLPLEKKFLEWQKIQDLLIRHRRGKIETAIDIDFFRSCFNSSSYYENPVEKEAEFEKKFFTPPQGEAPCLDKQDKNAQFLQVHKHMKAKYPQDVLFEYTVIDDDRVNIDALLKLQKETKQADSSFFQITCMLAKKEQLCLLSEPFPEQPKKEHKKPIEPILFSSSTGSINHALTDESKSITKAYTRGEPEKLDLYISPPQAFAWSFSFWAILIVSGIFTAGIAVPVILSLSNKKGVELNFNKITEAELDTGIRFRT